MRSASRFFGGQLEIDQAAAEAAGFDGAECNADDHPDSTDNPSFPTQVLPQEKADRESSKRGSEDCQKCETEARHDPAWPSQDGPKHQHDHNRRDQQWQQWALARFTNVIAEEGGEIDSHKGDQGAEIKHLRAQAITEDAVTDE